MQINSALLTERYNATQDCAVFPRLPQILCVLIPTAFTTSTWSLLVSLQRKHVKIHTLGLSWWASFFSLPICDRSGKTAINYKLCWTNMASLPHHIMTIPRKRDMASKGQWSGWSWFLKFWHALVLCCCMLIIHTKCWDHVAHWFHPAPPWPTKWTPWVSVELEMSKHFSFESTGTQD